MAIKIDLTQEPYFSIIRRWALRRQSIQIPQLPCVPDSETPGLRDLTDEIVSAIVRKHAMTADEMAELSAAVHHTLVQLGTTRAQQDRNREPGKKRRVNSQADLPRSGSGRRRVSGMRATYARKRRYKLGAG